jgi:hypothetical protein
MTVAQLKVLSHERTTVLRACEKDLSTQSPLEKCMRNRDEHMTKQKKKILTCLCEKNVRRESPQEQGKVQEVVKAISM